MQLLPQEVRDQLPALYATEEQPDPLVICKFFYPDFSWRWYAIEFAGSDIFFGWVDGDYPELGYFSLAELSQTRGKLGCRIERDCSFRPCRLSEVKKLRGRT